MPPKTIPDYPDIPDFYGEHNNWDKHIDRVLRELQRLYNGEILPVEEVYKYDTLRPSWFGETIAQKRPFITILGPFSAGKSTFINYLMQSNYLLTGPQPTTDKFTVIMHGDKHSQISGKVLVADQKQPFRGLNQFGEKFVECFGGVTAPHPILQTVSVIDTPGLLENQEGEHRRRYDYMQVCKWFVERSDIVCVLFDPTKLDAGIELKRLFDTALQGSETKMRFIMNKADTVSAQELMRIYGGLFWNLSKLIKTTEPPRVFVSSFWDQPYRPETNHALFTDEKSDLIYDLTEAVPLQSLDNRVTSVISRCKAVYGHIIVTTYMKEQLPVFGKEKAIKEMVANLPQIYVELARKHKCNPEDFPKPREYAEFFERVDLTKFPDAEKCQRKGFMAVLDRIMGQDLPALLKPIQSSAVADPRDRKHALMVQREYNAGMQRQLGGERGVQGGLGEAATPVYRQEAMPNAMVMAQNIQQAQAQQLQQSQAQQLQQGQAQQLQQAQMQQMMLQQQQQQQQALLMQQMMMMQQQQQQPQLMSNPMMMGMPSLPNQQLALMPNTVGFQSNSMPLGGVPSISHDQLLRLQQQHQMQQPNRPHQPRF